MSAPTLADLEALLAKYDPDGRWRDHAAVSIRALFAPVVEVCREHKHRNDAHQAVINDLERDLVETRRRHTLYAETVGQMMDQVKASRDAALPLARAAMAWYDAILKIEHAYFYVTAHELSDLCKVARALTPAQRALILEGK